MAPSARPKPPLKIEQDEPITALKRLVTFTWEYYLANPEFITLVNSENLHKARHIKKSEAMDDINKPFVARMQTLLERGVAQGLFRPGLDPVQILIALSGMGFHYLTNRHTGAIVYGRDLMSDEAKAARLNFNIDSVLRIVCRPDVADQTGETGMSGTALVTGARRGIGKAIALALADAGFDVAVMRS